MKKPSDYIYSKEYLADVARRHRRTVKGTISNKLQSCKKNARAKGFELDIDTEYLTELWNKQEGRCALTSVPMGVIGDGWASPTVDRIDPEKGYVRGNIQWTCWRPNEAKSNMTNEDFVAMCYCVAANVELRVDTEKVQRLSREGVGCKR